ncbi:fibrinogen-like YCDxxxxGGGW domain-containing protein [Brachybacterium sp. AOP42-C2-15]|uniref:fibrinogen-like YCDxxxxGGGW domain-containing protein n=1 Tax=Brachybacterium sp. AOP42-C2-15 TaxID=3457670 RepID=UPI0040337250
MMMSTLTAALQAVPVRRALRALLGLLVSVVTLLPLVALADQVSGAPNDSGHRVTDAAFAPAAVGSTSTAPEPDGLGEGTAAASCWEIKQKDPASQDGIYWLVTPELGAPQQFFCDQTTDGGGWVLVGRGRDYWTQSNEGRLTPSDVAQTPTGPSAFSPAQLSSDTIDGLLNDGRVDALAEGVRLRRARTTDGSTWQEVQFQYGTPRDDWSWQFAGSQSVSDWSMDSGSGRGGTTGSFGSDNSYRRVDTNVDGNRGWARGFSYGPSARGSSDSGSYVWASSSSSGYPRPFTQVFLRPRLMSQDIFTAIPETGLPEITGVATAQSYPMTSPWGVSGLGAAGSGELNTEVADFAESNGVMYVGGNFRYVQRDANGSGRVEQSYLAAFDVATGEWLPGFRPTFDNQVKALAVLPDGRIAVGGAFSTANGQSSPSFAVVDPATGASDPAVTTRVINYTGGTPPAIRSMDVQDGYLYLGGRFTHLTGSGVTSEVYQRNIGRLSATTLAPVPGWDPMLDGTVVSVDASAHGDQVYAAGYFGLSRWTEVTERAGAFTADDATVIPWHVDFSNRDNGRTGYQQAVREVGDRVWLGGSEHMLFSYDRRNMQEMSTNIAQNGGDFQAISPYGDDGLAAGCHCSENIYQGARDWPTVRSFSRVEHIEQAGIWRASDGAFVPEYSPQVSLRSGYGAWAIEEASDGALWVGGDYTYARLPNTQNYWTGAFIRFAPTDASAPSTPQGLTAASAAGVDQLTWDGVSDGTYEVLRDDRVVAATATTSLQLPTISGARYFVRAVDQAGNRSTTSHAVTPEVVDPGTLPVEVVSAGSAWAHYYETDAPSSTWKDVAFDDSTWANSPAPLGWGSNELGTELTAAGTKPLTAYFRHSFTLDDATQIAALELTTRADDGLVVYVNGTEVGRSNMPAGTVGHGTYATAAPRTPDAIANPLTLTAPGNLLVTGENVITAEVHLNYRSTPTLSYDLSAVLVPGEQPAPDPDPEPNPVPDSLLPAGSTWAHYYETDAPSSTWKDVAFDDSTWANSPAPLGWGSNELGTELTAAGTKPLTAYFRHSFTLDDATQIAALELTTRADDGLVVYVNGTEVGRSNMPAGTVGHGTYATAAPRTPDAIANPLTLTAPGNLLVTGENVITAEVHLNYRSTPTLSYDLSAVLVPGEQPQALAPIAAAADGAGTEDLAAEPDTAPEPEAAAEPDSTPEAGTAPDAAPETTEESTAGDSDGTTPAESDSAPKESDAEASDAHPAAEEEAPAPPASPDEADAADESQSPVCTVAATEPAGDDEIGSEATPEKPEKPENPDEVIALGADWAYDCGPLPAEDSEADWTSPDLDDSGWLLGAAPLGWGDPEDELGTGLLYGDSTPQVARYRHRFMIDSLDGVQSLELTVPANATYVLRINGVDAGRVDLQEEPLDPEASTDPTADSSGITGVQQTLSIPVSLLVEGENTISVEVLAETAPTPDLAFDAHGILAKEPQ